MNNLKYDRLLYLDYIRGFIVILVVLQHATQCYAHYWGGRFWFVPAPDRSTSFDILFMYTDSFAMQALFFVAGIFVLPSLMRRGWKGFVREKLIHLGVPFALGVIFIVPLLMYPKYYLTKDPYMSYWEFWTTIFFTHCLSSGGFWFLALLLILSFIIVVLHSTFPQLTSLLGKFVSIIVRRPLVGFLIVGETGAALIGISDLIWGAPWWIGFLSLFYVRANMFFSYILYFLLGVGFYLSDIYKDKNILERLSSRWHFWSLLTFILSLAYTSYSIEYFEKGAFSDEIRYFFRYGGEWVNAWPIIIREAPGILIRTTLHGFLCSSQIVFMIAIFYILQRRNRPFWLGLSASSYGIFIFHESLVVWTQFELLDNSLLPIIKCFLSFAIGLIGSWSLTVFLRSFHILKRVL